MKRRGKNEYCKDHRSIFVRLFKVCSYIYNNTRFVCNHHPTGSTAPFDLKTTCDSKSGLLTGAGRWFDDDTCTLWFAFQQNSAPGRRMIDWQQDGSRPPYSEAL